MQFTADSKKQSGNLLVSGLLVYQDVPESLVGKMCQVIEMLGLRESQERATKDTIKNLIYQTFSSDQGCRYIDRELVSVIDSVFWQARMYNEKNGCLTGNGDYSLTMTVAEPEAVPESVAK